MQGAATDDTGVRPKMARMAPGSAAASLTSLVITALLCAIVLAVISGTEGATANDDLSLAEIAEIYAMPNTNLDGLPKTIKSKTVRVHICHFQYHATEKFPRAAYPHINVSFARTDCLRYDRSTYMRDDCECVQC